MKKQFNIPQTRILSMQQDQVIATSGGSVGDNTGGNPGDGRAPGRMGGVPTSADGPKFE